MTEMPKVTYYHFTGTYTKIPSPKDHNKMVDGDPIFKSYPGRVRGPFEIIKPPLFRKGADGKPECYDNGELRFRPNVYEITIPMGRGYQDVVMEAYHLDVNFGTEWMESWVYMENVLMKKQAMNRHGERSYFEFVEEPIPVIEKAQDLVLSGTTNAASQSVVVKRK